MSKQERIDSLREFASHCDVAARILDGEVNDKDAQSLEQYMEVHQLMRAAARARGIADGLEDS